MDLIVTKWIALETTAILAGQYSEELEKRFPAALLQTAKDFEGFQNTEAEAQIAAEMAVAQVCSLADCGILTGLWQIAEAAGMGMEADLRKIPIRQETVEICEYFDLNPYYARSGGALLLAAADSDALILKLQDAGIPAVKIGYLNNGNDRILWNDRNKRYLDRPQEEELEKFYRMRGEES